MNLRYLTQLATLLVALTLACAAVAKPGVYPASDATLSGSVKLGGDTNLGSWKKNSSATWKLKKTKPGKYHVLLSYAVDEKSGGIVSVLLNDAVAGKFKVASTGGWKKYNLITVGPITITKEHETLTVTGVPSSNYLMNLQYVQLKKL